MGFNRGVIIWSLVLFSFTLSAKGHATSITPVVGVAQSSGSIDPAFGFTVKPHTLTYGGGVLFGFNTVPRISLELGFLYMNRGYKVAVTDGETTQYTLTTVQIPFLIRYWMFPSVSLGFGPYFSHAFGSVVAAPVSDPSSKTSTPYSFSTYGADDYGVIVSLGLKVKMLKFISIVADGRYLFGAQNISKATGVSTLLSDIQVFSGIQFGN